MTPWLTFLLLAAVIMYAGSNLSRDGDILAEKLGMSRTWIGIALIASITSLPELFTGLGAAAVFAVPDIAVGDVLGSCMFNLLILSLLDALGGTTPISSRAHQGHSLSLGFGIVLIGIVGISLLAGPRLPRVGWIGVSSLALIATYLVAVRTIFLYERRQLMEARKKVAEELRYAEVPLPRVVRRFAANAVLVIAAAVYLPHLGDVIAETTGLGQTFVGSIFVAVTTSLPEVATSLAALRLGAVDLAFGNLLGSNLFNILVLALDDVAYTRGVLLLSASSTHLVSALAAMLMSAIVVTGLTYQTIRKQLVLAWDSWGIVIVYVLTIVLLLG